MAGRGYGQLADWVGGSQPEQRACSYNLACHLGQEEGQLFGGRSRTPCGDLSNSSLPHVNMFPHITDCYHLSTILSEQNSRNAGLDPLPYFLTSCVTQLSDSPSKTLLFHFGFRERVPLRNVTVICLPLPDEC